MGLTDFRPFMRVEVDGDDITGILSPRLSSLTLTDAAGVQSDQVQIVLSDTELFGRIEEPAPRSRNQGLAGARLQPEIHGALHRRCVRTAGAAGYCGDHRQRISERGDH